MPAPPCAPDCRCGKHFRTAEHNAKISAALKAGGYRPPSPPQMPARRCTECRSTDHYAKGLCTRCYDQRLYHERRGTMTEALTHV